MGRTLFAVEPVGKAERQEVRDIDDFSRLLPNDRRAQHAGRLACDFDFKAVFDDIDDLVDNQADRAAAVSKDQKRLRAAGAQFRVLVRGHQRHQAAAILHHRPAARKLDLVRIDFLETGHERERHRFQCGRTRAEHQHRDRFRGVLDRRFLPGEVVKSALLAGGADRIRDPVRIEDQNHGTVAEDGIAAEHLDVAEARSHRLHDNFFGVQHVVYDDAEQAVADLHDHDERFGLRIGRALDRFPFRQLEQLAEREQRQQLVAQPQNQRAVDLFDQIRI